MASAKKCDACGRYYELYNVKKSAEETNGIMFVNLDSENKYFSHTAFDLCPDCMKAMREKFKELRGDNKPTDLSYKEEYTHLKRDFDSLLKRYRHLLQSEFIASFDEWNPKTNDYKRDIGEADAIVEALRIGH